MRNRSQLAGLLLGVALLSPALLASPAVGESASSPTVNIRYSTFAPASLNVPVGATVTWVHHDDDVHHSVTSGRDGKADGLYDHSLDGEGATFSYTFSRPGAYGYYCHFHSSMTGTVNVR